MGYGGRYLRFDIVLSVRVYSTFILKASKITKYSEKEEDIFLRNKFELLRFQLGRVYPRADTEK